MGRLVAVGLVALVAAACGGDGTPAAPPSPLDTTSTTATAVGPDTSAAATTPTTPPTTNAAAAPSIAAFTSGRGDDGSLEVGIWFAGDPFAAGDARLVVGTDSDDSFAGSGDPRSHLDGWAEIAEADVTLVDAGVALDPGGLDQAFSWTGPGNPVWVYFIGNVPVRAGTVWVIVEIDGASVTGGTAGAPLGDGCSFHSAGIPIGPVPGDVPDYGVPCRYPLG